NVSFLASLHVSQPHIALLELSRAYNHNDSNLGRGGIIHLFFQWTLFEISVRAQSAISQRSHHLDGLVSHVFACHCNLDLWLLFHLWAQPLLFEGYFEPLVAACHACCRLVSFSIDLPELFVAATVVHSSYI